MIVWESFQKNTGYFNLRGSVLVLAQDFCVISLSRREQPVRCLLSFSTGYILSCGRGSSYSHGILYICEAESCHVNLLQRLLLLSSLMSGDIHRFYDLKLNMNNKICLGLVMFARCLSITSYQASTADPGTTISIVYIFCTILPSFQCDSFRDCFFGLYLLLSPWFGLFYPILLCLPGHLTIAYFLPLFCLLTFKK